MAKLFQITLPEGMSNVKLNSQGSATVQYTVKNVSARPIDGRAVLVSLPQSKPPSGVVEKGWVKFDPADAKPDRHFDVGKEETFKIKIAVPPKSPPGNYTFRMDTVWVDQTDQGDPGGAVAFSVADTPPPPPFKWWIIPIILFVLIAIGLGVWLAVKGGGGPKVPDLVGKSLTDADTELKAQGLTLDSNVQTVDSDAQNSGKIISTNPPAGKKAKKGQTIQVTLGAELVNVPQLIGHPYQEVLGILNDKHLTPGQVQTVANPNFAGGVVTSQKPAPEQTVRAGTPVDMQVTPQTTPMPNVVGMSLGGAVLTLKQFRVNSLSGDQTKTVISQAPAAGTPVVVGSDVSLSFPGCVGFTCFYTGAAAHYMVAEKFSAIRDAERRGAPPPQ